MGRLLVFVLVMAAAYLFVNRLDSSAPGLREDGRQVVLETAQLEARFSRVGDLSESFMLFGGSVDRATNSLTHATLSGLAMRHARLIHQSYPDFHRCKSPGAAQAQRLVETMSLIGATRSARNGLADAVDLYGERLRSGGEQTCLAISGQHLTLDSVHLKEDGRDLTREVVPAFRGTRFTLAESVELNDCESLLR